MKPARTPEWDIIFLGGLEVTTLIGIYDWERQTRQTVIFDLEMAYDLKRAAISDRIEDTLDYFAVAQRITRFVEASEFYLIEKLAEEVARIILNEFNVPWLRLTLNKKGAVAGARAVGVTIERLRVADDVANTT